jgi:hypothetical protein
MCAFLRSEYFAKIFDDDGIERNLFHDTKSESAVSGVKDFRLRERPPLNAHVVADLCVSGEIML